MKANMGSFDRVMRILIAAGLFALAALDTPGRYLALTLAIILLASGAISFCPLYSVLNVSTK